MLSHVSDARDLSFAWQAVLGRLQLEVTTHNFETWLRGTRVLRLEGDTLIVEARRALDCEWLNQRLSLVVRRAIADALGQDLDVSFVPRRADAAAASPRVGAPAATVRSVFGSIHGAFTFERYVPAEGNRLAVQCCNALVDDAGLPISPVVVFGGPGMGKTHLLHALAARAADAGRRVVCLNAEEFTNRYMAAVRNHAVEDFQASVRGAGLLVVDDLQYVAGKRGTQDELVHSMEAVMIAGGYIAVASERHPFDLDLPDRLASRLCAGIITRIEPFVGPERREFIGRHAHDLRCALPGWAIDRIANMEIPSVRVLQGAVNAAVALQMAGQLDLCRLDLALTRLAIAETAPAASSDDSLLDLIARHFAVRRDELIGRASSKPAREARAAAVAVLKQRGRSLRQIGAVLDGRNASTIKDLAARGMTLVESSPGLRERLAG